MRAATVVAHPEEIQLVTLGTLKVMIIHIFSRSRLRSSLLVYATAVGLVTSVDAATCFDYVVDIQGTVSSGYGAQQFFLPGNAIVVDPGLNGNPRDFVLSTAVGRDLNQFAQLGDIELMTNSAFARNAGIASSRFNLANVAVADATQFALDSGMSFVSPPPNVFVAPGIGTPGAGGLWWAMLPE